MAIRFRKSIKIAPGVRVNISSSGVSATIGPRGFTHTISKDGIWRNVSIPGTGIYSREKIVGKKTSSKGSGTTSSKRRESKTSSAGTQTTVAARTTSSSAKQQGVPAAVKEWIAYTGDPDPSVTIDIDLEGKVTLYDKAGKAIADPQLLGIIKRTPAYRTQLATAREEHRLEVAEWVARYNAEADELVEICRYSPQVLPLEGYEQAIERIKQQEFDQLETLSVSELGELEEARLALERSLEGSPDHIEASAEEWVSGLTLPLEISAQLEYRADERCLMLDLDLPEIEDLPTQEAVQLASGDLRMRDKSQKRLREEYVGCILGLAVFLAAGLFNASPHIECMLVSGYTQRRTKAGDLRNCYLYSIRFEREGFYEQDFEAADPVRFCMCFENRCNLTQSWQLREIEPFE